MSSSPRNLCAGRNGVKSGALPRLRPDWFVSLRGHARIERPPSRHPPPVHGAAPGGARDRRGDRRRLGEGRRQPAVRRRTGRRRRRTDRCRGTDGRGRPDRERFRRSGGRDDRTRRHRRPHRPATARRHRSTERHQQGRGVHRRRQRRGHVRPVPGVAARRHATSSTPNSTTRCRPAWPVPTSSTGRPSSPRSCPRSIPTSWSRTFGGNDSQGLAVARRVVHRVRSGERRGGLDRGVPGAVSARRWT